MAITTTPYTNFLIELATGDHDFSADTYKVALLTPSHVPNLTTHAHLSDVSSGVVQDASYTGAKTLTGLTVTNNAGSAYISTPNPVEWLDLTATVRYAVIYRDSGSAGTSSLVGLINFGTDRIYADEPFVLTFNSGVMMITVAV